MSKIIQYLDRLITEHHEGIEAWLAAEFSKTPPSFYSSVDLRHSGYKIAPVDTNLFPAGFNNLNESAIKRASEQVKKHLDHYFPQAKRILLIPEEHTRNLFYLDNITTLKHILEQAGKEVALGFINASEPQFTLTSASGTVLSLAAIENNNGSLIAKGGFVADLIVLNNDLTTGIPPVLQGISQPVIPSPWRGWHKRRKSTHFTAYNTLARQLGEQFHFDPWLISTIFHQCGTINFKEAKGVECVALGVDKVIHQLRQKYEEYGITEKPYVFIKADRGTYGMGIMTAHSGEELYAMNKKIRKKMEVVKGGTSNTEVIIQEGIPTIDTIDGKVAEPFIYSIGDTPVGCIYRINQSRDAYENLNASGMTFEQSVCEEESDAAKEKPCKRGVFNLVARLAALAAVREETTFKTQSGTKSVSV